MTDRLFDSPGKTLLLDREPPEPPRLIADEEHRTPKDTPIILALEQCKRYAMMARALKQAREVSVLEEVK